VCGFGLSMVDCSDIIRLDAWTTRLMINEEVVFLSQRDFSAESCAGAGAERRRCRGFS